jgi:single-strand DNA-binding protein
MNGKTPLSITGNLTADVELAFTPNGTAVTNFTVASNPRVYNQQTGEWQDGQALFMRCRVWREQAENVAESKLRKGTRVTVTGTLVQRSWEDDQQQKHTVYELEADDVSASMRNARLTVKRIARNVPEPDAADQPRTGTDDDPPPF